ncbi:72 kDa type IV collagenase-like [Acropora palmata]|uniref:72 kDa type IV collagenase-like n=1 Tax=Acropora palmata TaxID=6131 RepID=UPI003DA0CEB2
MRKFRVTATISCTCSTACAQETTSGECCSFPFEYKGKTYDSCTMVDGNRPWCSLTPIYDKKRRRDCLLPQPPPCSIKTTTGECCSIPFKYKGKTYDSCTLVDLNTPWCSLDPVYNGTRGNCGKYSCYTELLFGNNYEQEQVSVIREPQLADAAAT